MYMMVWSTVPMERLISRSRVEEVDFTEFTICSSEFLHPILEQGRGSVFDLNRLYFTCSAFSQQEWDKLVTAVSVAAPKNSVQLRYLAQSPDFFDFIPGAHTPEEYGRHKLQPSIGTDYDSTMDEFYDYGKYGQSRIQDETVVTGGKSNCISAANENRKCASDKHQTVQDFFAIFSGLSSPEVNPSPYIKEVASDQGGTNCVYACGL